MLTYLQQFVAVPSPLSAADGYHIHADKVAEELARGTSVILTSNPRNPTGHALSPEELIKIKDICRGKSQTPSPTALSFPENSISDSLLSPTDRATIIFDEFYAGYNYSTNCDGTTISAASNIVDVDADDVIIIDGLTKRFRLPGWRICWIVGPKEFISALGSCGSYLDGGANVPFQEAAIPMLDPTLVKHEMVALQKHFKEKRDYCLGRLKDIGFRTGTGQGNTRRTF